MDITRRIFLKIAGGTRAAAGIGTGVGVTPALAMPRKVQHAQEVPTICPRSEERPVGKESRSRWSPYH